MALFKKEKPKVVLGKFQHNTKTPFIAVLKTVIEIGDMEDYEYLCEKSANKFFEENEKYLLTAINNNEDDFSVFTELLNYFFESFSLGNFEIVINEQEKQIKIYHYNSPFKEFEKETFLKEFYKTLFQKLLEAEINIKEEKDDEKVIFTVF
jgi:hypothetical protein